MNQKLYIVVRPISKDIFHGSIINSHNNRNGESFEHLLGFYDEFDYSCVVTPELAEHLPDDAIKLYLNFYYFTNDSISITLDNNTINKINSDKNSYCWIFSPHEILMPLNVSELLQQSGINLKKIIYTTSSFEDDGTVVDGVKYVSCPEWWEAQYRYHLKLFSNMSFIAPTQKFDMLPNASKKMLSLNRNIKGHRVWWYNELLNSQLLNDSHVSYHLPTAATFANFTNSQFNEWMQKELGCLEQYYTNYGFEKHYTLDPRLFSTLHLDQLDDMFVINYKQSIQEYYHDSLCSVISESFYSRMFLTEKTFKAIVHCHPFIIIGDSEINDELKRRGYKTYEKMFGAQSLIPFVNSTEIIQYLEKLTVDQIRDLVYEHWDIVNHNWNHFFTRKISWKTIETAILKAIV